MGKRKGHHSSKSKRLNGSPNSKSGGTSQHFATSTTIGALERIDRTHTKLPTKRKRLREEANAAIPPPEQYEAVPSGPHTPPNDMAGKSRRADTFFSASVLKNEKRGKGKGISSLEGN
jgi:hypothetical protein